MVSCQWGLHTSRAQNPFSERHDHSGALGEWDEHRRRDDSALWVVPPHEGLEALETAGNKGDDWLVMKGELVPGDCLAQLGLEGQPLDQRLVHGGLEDLDLSFAEALCAMHRKVGVAQQLLCTAFDLADHDADGGVGCDGPAMDGDRCANDLEDLSCNRARLFLCRVLEQDGELVTAEASDRIGWS